MNWHSSFALRLATVFAATAAILPCYQSAGAQQPFRVIHQWNIGGEGGWDYMAEDAPNHRLYLAHNATVEVVDTKTGKKIGAISGMQSTHGVALDAGGKYGYISDGKGNAVVIFNRHSLATVATLPAGTNPDGIVFEPVTKTVWAFNGRSQDVTVIDTTANKVIATIKLPGKPEFPTADGKGLVFDNIEDKNEIVKLDARAQAVVTNYPLEGCEAPSGMAIDRAGRRLFSVCDSKVMTIVDADSGKVIASAPIGEGPDATRFDALRGLAFSSNGETGDMTVIDVKGRQPKVLQTLKTMSGARTMTLNEKTGHVYTESAQFGPKPAPSASNPHGRPVPVPGTFTVLEIGR